MLNLEAVKKLSEVYQVDEEQIINVLNEGFTLEEVEEMLIHSEL